jgi:hypothetical protein
MDTPELGADINKEIYDKVYKDIVSGKFRLNLAQDIDESARVVDIENNLSTLNVHPISVPASSVPLWQLVIATCILWVFISFTISYTALIGYLVSFRVDHDSITPNCDKIAYTSCMNNCNCMWCYTSTNSTLGICKDSSSSICDYLPIDHAAECDANTEGYYIVTYIIIAFISVGLFIQTAICIYYRSACERIIYKIRACCAT